MPQRPSFPSRRPPVEDDLDVPDFLR